MLSTSDLCEVSSWVKIVVYEQKTINRIDPCKVEVKWIRCYNSKYFSDTW